MKATSGSWFNPFIYSGRSERGLLSVISFGADSPRPSAAQPWGTFPTPLNLLELPAKTLGPKMSGGRELSDYLLLPLHSTGWETEAQIHVVW